MKILMSRKEKSFLTVFVVFVFFWTQAEHIGDFFEGFFEGYERTRAEHLARDR